MSNNITSAYTIQTSDAGGQINATAGLYAITLPGPTGFAEGSLIRLFNGDSGSGKQLTGFPGGNPILWPKQQMEIQVVNGAWALTDDPGRWRLPAAMAIYFATSGSAANDGLTSSTPLPDAATAAGVVAAQWDTDGKQVTLQSNPGQAWTQNISLGVSFMGGGPIVLDGGGSSLEVANNHGIIVTSPLDAMLTIQNWYIQTSYAGNPAGGDAVGIFAANKVIIGNMAYGNCYHGAHREAQGAGVQIIVTGVQTIYGGADCGVDYVNLEGEILYSGGSLNIQSDISIDFNGYGSGFVFAGTNGTWNGAPSISTNGHTVYGKRFRTTQGGDINTGGQGVNFFPGTVAGQQDPGSNYG